MARPRNHGVTLVELLVTMVVSSVVLVGLGTLYVGASADFRRAAAMREERYARQGLESELVWRLKVVPPDLMPSGAQLPRVGTPPAGFLINFIDDRNVAQVRRILAFDYLANDTRTRVPAAFGGLILSVDGTGCSVTIPDPTPGVYDVTEPEKIDVKTAAIFQFQSAVYWVERSILSDAESFRTMARAGSLPLALTRLFNTPPVLIPRASPPMPLAIGIENFEPWIEEPAGGLVGACGTVQLADSISRRRVQWRYTQYATQ